MASLYSRMSPEWFHFQVLVLSETQYVWLSMKDVLKFVSLFLKIAKVAWYFMHSLCAWYQVQLAGLGLK